MKKLLVILAILAALLLGGYKVYTALQRGTVAGGTAVAEFHSALNAGKDTEIYDGATAAFRSATTKDAFLKFIGDMRAELGAFKSAGSQSVNLNNNNGNTTLGIGCLSLFEKGEAEEKFVFDYNSERPLLLRYDVKKKIGTATNAP